MIVNEDKAYEEELVNWEAIEEDLTYIMCPSCREKLFQKLGSARLCGFCGYCSTKVLVAE